MDDKPKQCAACGNEPRKYLGKGRVYLVVCNTHGCYMQGMTIQLDQWQHRPIEDRLTAELAASRGEGMKLLNVSLAHTAERDAARIEVIMLRAVLAAA